MLIYAMTLLLLSLCDSFPSQVNSFNELALIQHYSVTSVTMQELMKLRKKPRSSEVAEYVKDLKAILEAQEWVINSIRSFNSEHKILIQCENSKGKKSRYNNLDENFKQILKTIWPRTAVKATHESVWEEEFNTFGSCVAEDESSFFKEALQLMQKYNVGKILSDIQIYPGNIYELDDIANMITNAVGKQVYLGCISTRDKRQNLLEVQVCFNTSRGLTDCSYRDGSPIHYCSSSDSIFYPELPLDLL